MNEAAAARGNVTDPGAGMAPGLYNVAKKQQFALV
jgi:hypothetical protein